MPLISMHGLVLKFKCKVKDSVPIPQFFIMIYLNKSSAISRNPRYDTDPVEFDDIESDKLSRSISNNSSKASDATSADSSIDHEGALPMKDRLGNLYFEYYDTCSPHWRILLMDKVNNLFR
ncbi:hypothetical protein RJ639_034552 [Escallonia herrerae]|uniref:Uncharacterized protein n=1 Tax=Escallonia herrerae TaxID=1293975 RepID=A0AA89BAX0_9ASTE|nr:hypothetical protein RJ639_034552 [Escallonia herrerae]